MAARSKGTKKPKKARKSRFEDFEQAVYGDSRAAGFIYQRSRVITAETADGQRLGEFKTSNEAMLAILAAERAAREGV